MDTCDAPMAASFDNPEVATVISGLEKILLIFRGWVHVRKSQKSTGNKSRSLYLQEDHEIILDRNDVQ